MEGTLRVFPSWSCKVGYAPLDPPEESSMIKRTKEIKIRVTEDEYQALLNRKTKVRLAEWLRDLALDQKPQKTIKPVDPQLLFLLNKISTNINQIAKQCNIQKSNIDLISVALSLKQIEDQLKEIINHDY